MPDKKMTSSPEEFSHRRHDFFLKCYAIPEPEELITFLLDSLRSLLNAQSGSFFLWDEYRKELVLKTSRGLPSEKLKEIHVKLQQNVMDWVRTQHHSSFFISLPLTFQNKFLGVINLAEKENALPFDEEDLALARMAADHFGMALDRLKEVANLRHDTRKLQHALDQARKIQLEQQAFVELGKLAANLAQEIHNPLDPIRRHVHLAYEEVQENCPAKEHLAKAKKGIYCAIQLMRSFLDLFKYARSEKVEIIKISNYRNELRNSLVADPEFEIIKRTQPPKEDAA